MFIPPSELSHVVDLYDRGYCVRAYQEARQMGALENWEGTSARILAGRLLNAVGAPKLGRKFQFSAYRHDRKDWEARYQYARLILRYRGPIETWKFMRRFDKESTLVACDPKLHSDWLALHARVLALLRDFDHAEQWMEKAESIGPTNNWLWVERARLFEVQDRYEDALGVLRYALLKQPQFRPAISSAAHLLILLGKDEEALRLLANALQRVECAHLVGQLAQLQIELEQYTAARQSLEYYTTLSPLIEPEVLQWLNSQRADVAYLSGDYPAAVVYAQKSDSAFLKETAAKLQAGATPGKRVILPVNFIRQHHLTCSPAVLSMISGYYQMPADHLSIAEEICYDGTHAYSERKWALKNGYAVREFCVTWENAVELINRGIVFTLGVIDPGNGHMQAVIGYDSVRGTLIVRDPHTRNCQEIETKYFLERYRSSGPRGMALVPASYANLLQSLNLNEADLYDRLYAVQEALAVHDREKASHIYQNMRQICGDHRLGLQAKLALANYDGNYTQILACYDKLLELFPNEINHQLSRAACLQMLVRRNERLEYLRQVCAKKNSHPLLWQEYAEELSEDARYAKPALRWIRRIIRHAPTQAQNVHLLANVYWKQKRHEEAFEFYRFATCLDDKDEKFAQSYFLASHYLNRAETAIELLKNRAHRFGEKSALPARTLFQAYEKIGRRNDAFETLKTGMEMRPDDGELKLYVAEAYARYGNFEQAQIFLQEAQAPPNLWLRTAATIATFRGDLNEALLHWLQVSEADPLAIDANRCVAQLLTETEGPQATVDFLRSRISLYPYNQSLRHLLIDWLADDPATAEVELRQTLKIDPSDDWAQRKLALVLNEKNFRDEALAVSHAACQIDPANPDNHYVRGQILASMGNLSEARKAYTTAIQLSADHTAAIAGFVHSASTIHERRDLLQFVWQELMQQIISGDGLLAFRDLAREALAPDELLSQLYESLRLRPELHQSWSAVINQLTEMQQILDALSLALKATERFPLSPRAWFDLASAHEANLNFPSQIAALQQVLAIDSAWLPAVQKLAEAYERIGKLRQARNLLEQAVTYAPFDPYTHGYLASILWKLSERESALRALQKALALSPEYEWGWRTLRNWADELKRPELALQCARELTVTRPGDPRSWLTLAKILKGESSLEEQLTALNKAIQLNPRLIEAHSLRAFLLADAGRYDEALAASRPPIFGREIPPELRTAEAYVEAQRGDVQKALKKMRAALHEEPNYAPGWERMARWCRTYEYHEEYLEAAQQLVRLLPNYAVALGYLGEARLWTRDREGAKEAFQHALALAPDYEFVGFTLFDLYLEDGNLRAAENVLEVLKQHLPGDATTLRSLRYATRKNDGDQAHDHFYALCLSKNSRSEYLDQAYEALNTARQNRVLDLVLETSMGKVEAHPHVGSLWVRRLAEQKKSNDCLNKLDLMARQGGGPLWHSAAREYLSICAQTEQTEMSQKFIRRYARLLQLETETWGVVGNSLYQLGDAQETANWMLDWEERKDVAAWMLWDLALALRELGREDEARAVSIYAVQMPEDRSTNSHLALLALDEAFAGKFAGTSVPAAKMVAQGMSEWDQVIFSLGTELRNFHQARAEGRSIGQTVIDQILRLAQQSPWLRTNQLLSSLFKRAVDHILKTENDSMLKIKTKLKMKWFEYRGNN